MKWSECLTVFLLCALKPGIGGIPAAVFGFQFSFIWTVVVCSSGAVCGTVFFAYILDWLIKKWMAWRDSFFTKHPKVAKRFTFKNRLIIRVKRSFGLIGIAALSPLFFSIPLGVFLCLRFFGDRKKTIFWISIFSLCWTIILYFLFQAFGSFFKEVLL